MTTTITIGNINAFMSNTVCDCDCTKSHFYQQGNMRVAKIVDSDSFDSCSFTASGHFIVHIRFGNRKDSLVRFDFIKTGDVILHFIRKEIRHLNIADTLGRFRIGDNVFGPDFLIGLVYAKNILLKLEV